MTDSNHKTNFPQGQPPLPGSPPNRPATPPSNPATPPKPAPSSVNHSQAQNPAVPPRPPQAPQKPQMPAAPPMPPQQPQAPFNPIEPPSRPKATFPQPGQAPTQDHPTPSSGIPQAFQPSPPPAKAEKVEEEAKEEMPYSMSGLLHEMVDREASDLHLAAGRPPVIRIHGGLVDVEGPRLTPGSVQRLIYSVLSDVQKRDFEEFKELDFSLGIANLSRFRVNVHMQRGSVAAAFRAIPTDILDFESLHLPRRVLTKLCHRPQGFVLVTGPTGSGKSTTLAAMIDYVNAEVDKHIITVEDPIEYLHPHKKCLVEQRELNEDTLSFSNALKYALRQDPDILMIGEMRDIETIQAALTAAETGHLVFSTLHTPDVVQTCDRIIDVFPPHQQEQIRVQFAGVIEGVLCQKLLPSVFGGREIALEILLATDAVRNQIRERLTPQLYTTIQANLKNGMVTMDRSLVDLYQKGRVTKDVVLFNAKKPDEIMNSLQ